PAVSLPQQRCSIMTGQYLRRRKSALWVTVSLLALALVVLTVGLISATRTDNVPVAGFYPGITLSFGAFLGIVGIHLVENRRPMLMAAIIFISIGVIASFFCAIMDGIIASEFIVSIACTCVLEKEETQTNRTCFLLLKVTCRSFDKACKLKLRSNTCYCCYMYNCESTEYHTQYYEFTGVSSCWDVIHLHRLLWASVVLNVIGLFLGIITAAILGAYKDMVSTIQNNRHLGSYQPPSSPQPIPEGGPASSSCLSEENQNQQPSQAPTPPQPQGAPEAGGYMLTTPNAPVLYGSSYSPFEKPPPYAC
uniref:Transmembrane protein 255B n=1 Tax=Mola mola TaxID=94237 RepID=A0A3Q3WZ00_MOLML